MSKNDIAERWNLQYLEGKVDFKYFSFIFINNN